MHQEYGPSYNTKNDTWYYRRGLLHRLSGPAQKGKIIGRFLHDPEDNSGETLRALFEGGYIAKTRRRSDNPGCPHTNYNRGVAQKWNRPKS